MSEDNINNGPLEPHEEELKFFFDSFKSSKLSGPEYAQEGGADVMWQWDPVPTFLPIFEPLFQQQEPYQWPTQYPITPATPTTPTQGPSPATPTPPPTSHPEGPPPKSGPPPINLPVDGPRLPVFNPRNR
jgi:hypothetical protein